MNTAKSTYAVPADFFKDALVAFSGSLAKLVSDSGLEVGKFPIDHIAIRPSNDDAFGAVKRALTHVSSHVSTKVVNGRDILAFRLKQPVTVLGQDVSVVEVPYPKSEAEISQAPWDHIEFVVPTDATNAVEMKEWLNGFAPSWGEKSLPNVEVTFDQPVTAVSERPNPHVSGADKGTGLFFRLHPVELGVLREGSWLVI